jgi:hypothetical protein
MNTTEAAKNLLASNPAIARKAMVAIDTMVERGVAKDLGISPRFARALLRSTGRI